MYVCYVLSIPHAHSLFASGNVQLYGLKAVMQAWDYAMGEKRQRNCLWRVKRTCHGRITITPFTPRAMP